MIKKDHKEKRCVNPYKELYTLHITKYLHIIEMLPKLYVMIYIYK